MPVSLPITFDVIRTEEQLRALHDFDHDAYGGAGITYERLKNWWEGYPQGLHVVSVGGKIVGALGAWPLSQDLYRRILAGTAGEAQIDAAYFDLADRSRWYVSGINFRPEHRHTGLVSALIFRAIERLKDLSEREAIDVCAIATSSAGQRMLIRFGFESHGIGRHGYEVFVYPEFRLGLESQHRVSPAPQT